MTKSVTCSNKLNKSLAQQIAVEINSVGTLDILNGKSYRNITMNTPENRNAKKRCCSIPPEEELVFPTLNSEEKLALLMKALGHPARVKIIKLLLARDECICGEICREIPLAQSTISQHLKVLKDAGLIFGEVDGPRVCYCVNTVRLEHLKLLLSEL